MIIVTGGDGFIGKNLIKELNKRGYKDVVSLDVLFESINDIRIFLIENVRNIEGIFHLGAITNTIKTDVELFNEYNLSFSIFIWNFCALYKIPLIYASSGATYGYGDNGFDDEKSINNLKPLNPYGDSKHKFDLFTQNSYLKPPFWYGLKFFNVYGYGEAHKKRMASVVHQFYNQIIKSGQVELFKSNCDGIEDGEQKRDFIYVDDILKVCIFMYEKKPESGLYNVGTGKARSYNELANLVFNSLKKPVNIEYIDIPLDLVKYYQYYTEAKINKLRNAGYVDNFCELEEGIFKTIEQLGN